MRAAWALVVVCLVAATGVAPAGAAVPGRDTSDDGDAQAQLGDPHAALTAVPQARHAASPVVTRERGPVPRVPPAVLAAVLTLRARIAMVTIELPRRSERRGGALAVICSARGPP